MTRGKFITFEGGEGAGKTTLIEGVARFLSSKGFLVHKTREPGGTALAEKIRILLLENQGEKISCLSELALFLASRAQHIEEVLLPAIKSGKMVLCDRFNDSSVAYQGIARGLGKQEVSNVCTFFSNNLMPDITFYLDIDPAIGLARAEKTGKPDRIEGENFSFHKRVREGFLEIAKMSPDRVHVLDGSIPKERILEQTLSILNGLI